MGSGELVIGGRVEDMEVLDSVELTAEEVALALIVELSELEMVELREAEEVGSGPARRNNSALGARRRLLGPRP